MKLKRIIAYLFLLIILLLGLSFAAINANPVTVNYYLGTASVSLSLLIVYTLGIGIVLGFVTLIIPWFKLKRENRMLKNTIKKVEKQITPATNINTPN